jgi:hypothetical protein
MLNGEQSRVSAFLRQGIRTPGGLQRLLHFRSKGNIIGIDALEKGEKAFESLETFLHHQPASLAGNEGLLSGGSVLAGSDP